MNTNVILLVIFSLLSVLYLPLNRRASRYYWKTKLDHYIPLIPVFVIPYVAFFPFLMVTIVLVWNTVYSTELLLALILAKVFALSFWYVFPNGTARPEILGETWRHKLLLHIYRHDHDTNAFPSSHVFITLICAYFLAVANPALAVGTWVVAFLISVSTVFTKQHHVIDIAGGILVAFPVVCIVHSTGLLAFR